MPTGNVISLDEYGQAIIDELQQNKACFIDDVGTDARATELDRKLAESGLHAWLYLPLLYQGQLIGALNLARGAGKTFNHTDAEIAYDIANQLAIAIQQTRLNDALHKELEDRKQIEASLRQRESMLEAVTFAAEQFLKTSNWRANMDIVLASLGKTITATHSYLFEHTLEAEDMETSSLRYEWTAPGYLSSLNDPVYQARPIRKDAGTTNEILRRGETFIGTASTFPPIEKGRLNKLGIKAMMEAPVFVNGHWWGTIGVDDMKKERDWSPAEVDVIRLAANVLGAAIKRQMDENALQNELAERKRLERELQEERDFAFQIINTMGQGLTLTDEEGRFVLVNPAYARLMGYEPQELIGKSPNEVTLPESQKTLEQARTDRQRGRTTTYESQLRRKDGSIVHVLITGLPRLKDGKFAGTIASITDLTEIKRAEEEREKLIAELTSKNTELEQFTYTVSHDLKSPLVTINGFIGYLEQDAASGNTERLKGDVQRIQDAVNKMQRLLNELLELSRVGRLMNPPQVIPFEQLVREALDLVHGSLTARGVNVQTQPNMPRVMGDKPRLVEVMQNLLDNAAKYMGDQPNPHVEIGQAGEEDGKPILYVKDNGIGIAPEHHERIFGLFNKLDAKSEGTGVGLALVKRIVEVHGGRIWVQSEVGLGSTFLFTLPTQPGPDSVI